MILLTDLTKSGYLKMKSDREILEKKIFNIQTIIDEFDLALPFLESIYEPKVSIFYQDNIGFYVATVVVPYQGEDLNIVCKVGTKTQFDGDEDPNLLKKAHSMIEGKITEMFPLHFSK
jgi:hypothetical protein